MLSKYSDATSRTYLTGTKNWTITDGGASSDFVSTWAIPSDSYSFELPLKDYANITIDWGDSSTSTHTNQAFPTHTYSSSGLIHYVTVNEGKRIGEMY